MDQNGYTIHRVFLQVEMFAIPSLVIHYNLCFQYLLYLCVLINLFVIMCFAIFFFLKSHKEFITIDQIPVK
jgi:hypothetical protein